MPQNDVTTKYPVAFPGMEPDNSTEADAYISRASGETLLQLPFGMMVMQGVADDQCLGMASQTGFPLGIVPYAAAYQVGHELGVVADSNGNLGILPGQMVSIKRRGRLWVTIDEDVKYTDAVRVRTSCVATFGPGSFRKTALATHTVDCSKFAHWVGTNLAANGYGLLEFDFHAAFALMSADS